MNSINKSLSINETYIIESVDSSDIFSACTSVYSNEIISCSGNTSVLLQNGVISFNGNVLAQSVSGTTFFGDGSHLTGISTQDTFVTGGTYSNGTAVFTNNSGGTFSVTGFSTSTGTSFTGGTVSGNTVFTNGITASTISATTYLGLPPDIHTTGFTFNTATYDLTIKESNGVNFTQNLAVLASDMTVTGGTYNPSTGVATFVNNTGGTFSVSGFLTGFTDIYTTGGTFNKSTSTLTLRRNDNNFFNISGFTDNTITGGTYNSTTGIATFNNNTGGTFSVSGFSKPSDDIFVTSGNVDHFNNTLNLQRTNSSDVVIDDLVDIVQITQPQLIGLINDNGLIRGMTYLVTDCDKDTYSWGTSIYLKALEPNKISEYGVGVFYNPKYSKDVGGFGIWNGGEIYNINSRVIWGGKVWINLTGNVGTSDDTFNLNTDDWSFLNPLENRELYNTAYDEVKYDVVNDVLIYRNEKNVNIVSTTYENILSWKMDMNLYSPIKAFQWGNTVEYVGRPTPVEVGIGPQRIINSYNENINFRGRAQHNIIFENESYQYNTNFAPTSYQSELHFNNESFQIGLDLDDNSYQTNLVFDNSSSQNKLTLRHNTYQQNFKFNNSSQNTTNIDRYQSNFVFDNARQLNFSSFHQTNMTIKNYVLDRNIISVVNDEDGLFYINDLPNDKPPVYIGKLNNQLVEVTIPLDVRVTGGTYSNGSAVFTNNEGTSFSVTGFSTGTSFTGGTVSGSTVFTNGVSANTISATSINATTISATTYQNLPKDVFVTGGTFSAGTTTFRNNTGGTFTITGFSTSNATSFTGGTVSGATIFTGGLSANTFSATTYLGLPLDIRVTGGTYSNGTAVFTNNTGGTFSVIGLTTPFTGGTVVGATNFTGNLTTKGNLVPSYGLVVATTLGYQNLF